MFVCVGQISSSHLIEKDQKMIQFYGSSNRFEDPWYIWWSEADWLIVRNVFWWESMAALERIGNLVCPNQGVLTFHIWSHSAMGCFETQIACLHSVEKKPFVGRHYTLVE
jgi:hypothetical protein